MSNKKQNLYLSEIFKQYVAIKDADFKQAQEVFNSVFAQVKQNMGEHCNYFKKYSSQVEFAGSVYDGLKVSKMDEFDMDIVIRLPICYDDIIIENDSPGYVKLKITDAFDNLPKQPNWEKCHKVTMDWRDTDKYLLQSKFRHWMHGILQKALNTMEGKVTVNGKDYLLMTYKESGPAYTLKVRRQSDDQVFKLDVDLVPVIRFSYLSRYPQGYRTIDNTKAKHWFVVPKPNKSWNDETRKSQCWRLSFQEQEREIIKGAQQLKTTIRLVKKLRDGLEMKDIASYYIKSLFLRKVYDKKETDSTYWQNSLSFLFRAMVEELYEAIRENSIPFFWHSEHNLLESLRPSLRKQYSDKLKCVLLAIDTNDVDKVAEALLNSEEIKSFRNSAICVQSGELSSQNSVSSATDSPAKPSVAKDLKKVVAELNSLSENITKEEYLELKAKVCDLEDRMALVEKRLVILERGEKKKKNGIISLEGKASKSSTASLSTGNVPRRLAALPRCNCSTYPLPEDRPAFGLGNAISFSRDLVKRARSRESHEINEIVLIGV